MLLDIALFIIYLSLFSYLLTIIPFIKQSSLGKKTTIFLFMAKVAVGIGYGYYFHLPKQIETADTWRFFETSKAETETLRTHPIQFFADFIYFGYDSPGGLFSGKDSYWNDLKDMVPIKMMGLFNPLAHTNYYIEVIFFNFIFFIGLVALYRLLTETYGEKRIPFILTVFCIPSTLFFCSGIHKDGLILSSLGVLLYVFHRCLQHAAQAWRLLLLLLPALFIFILRNYCLLLLLPSLLIWYLCHRFTWQVRKVATLVYGIGIIAFLGSSQLSSGKNPLVFVVNKHQEFDSLKGNSRINTGQLAPTTKGFFAYAPTALSIAFLQPSLFFAKQATFIPFFIEWYALLGYIAFAIIYKSSKPKARLLSIAFLTFSVSLLLLNGYIVNFVGAVIRYRSVVLPLLLSPFIGLDIKEGFLSFFVPKQFEKIK